MFTGIVQTTAPVLRATRGNEVLTFALGMTPTLLDDLKIGASVAIEGCCLSVTSMGEGYATFDAMLATLERTNLARIADGVSVNVERSMKPTDENGGHMVSGHVSTTAQITALETEGPKARISFRVAPEWAKYIFVRGFLAVNGCSLTVGDVQEDPAGDIFTVYLIPETLRSTTFGTYKVGDYLNIEVEHQTMITVEVMERTLTRLLRDKTLA
ncbi:riboflavin synthase subunit alpha [Ketogulonicigenium robustum]|uniref:Riboflavin synthase n=1 Tax=Ketogulonicigenium robustum TaxID=92947 RepID=A0A1W6NZQ4_9RHOB|nr:riboflavin synthase subunit alpha [Ketogulonicigenium robustum]ARO14735.1 riboflavin synthase subunit alpha [Ketogulonicigenium robustum]